MSLSDFQCFSSQKLASPGGMNWRGTWGIPGIYQYADVVEGPDGEGYVCIDFDGTIGQTPGTNPAVWQLLSSGTATAVSLSSADGSGITVGEPTPNNFTVATNLVAGSGISLTPSVVIGNKSLGIGNSGVLGVSAGTGISVGGTAQNPSIANAGVLGITSGSAAITVGGTAQNPVITQALPSTTRIVDSRFPAAGPGITGTSGVSGGQIGAVIPVVPNATYNITISGNFQSTANSTGTMSISVAPTAGAGAGPSGQAFDLIDAVESTVSNGGGGSATFTVPAAFTNYALFVSGFGTTGTISATVWSAYLTRIA
jgi:hypothetical protein